MIRRLRPSALVAAAIACAVATRAEAAPCNYTPAQFATDLAATPATGTSAAGFSRVAGIGVRWAIPNSRILCPGTYAIPDGAMFLTNNRILEVGEATSGPTAGLPGITILRAPHIRILGRIVGNGNGTQANACTSPNRGAGGAGYSAVAGGGGLGGPAWSGSSTGGGGGGGGAGHGADAGAGGRGNSSAALGGGNGSAYGTATDFDTLHIGSTGGGGACASDGDDGGPGGRGGAVVVLDAKDLFVAAQNPATTAAIAVNGVNGAQAPNFQSGGAGGGGSGGSIALRATEAFNVPGRLESNGGNGAAGRNDFQRAGGGGGGGSGGRIKVQRVGACSTLTTSVAAGAAGAGGGGSAQAGEPGRAGSVDCRDIQVAPVVSNLVAAPASVAEGGGTVLTATATDANGHLLRYEFDCDGNASTGANGGFEAVPTPTTSNTFTCPAFTDNGSRTLRVRVTDWNSVPVVSNEANAVTTAVNTVAMGGATIRTVPVTVTNVAPTAALTVPASVNEGTTFNATASATDPSSVDTTAGFTFNWTMGDGTTFTGPGRTSVSHAYPDNGSRTVGVEVVDKDNGRGTASQVVTVNNLAPSAVLGPIPANIVQDPNANAGSGFLESVSTFTASGTDPGPADLAAGFAYSFTFTPPGGGTPEVATVTRQPGNASGVSVARRFATAGIWTLAVTVTDKDGATSAVAQTTFTVNPRGAERGPNIVITADPGDSVDESASITFTATLDDPNPGDNAAGFSLQWRCDATAAPVNAVIAAGAGTARTATLQCTYPDSGSATLSLAASDRTGTSNAASLPVTIRNVAPIVVAGAAPTGVVEGGSATVTATASDLSPADVAAGFTFTVDFGDGSDPVTTAALAALEADHTYADSGTYTVRITAQDVDGGTGAEVTLDVVIGNVNPTVALDAPAGGPEGSVLAFTATPNDVSPADAAAGFTFEWNFGDGSPAESGTGDEFASRTHAYPQDGSYDVTVTVTDKDGGTATATSTVAIANVAPSVQLGGDVTVVRGETINLAATVSDPGANDVLAYAWTFGDGTTSDQTAPSKSYANLGSFTIRLTVSDEDGASAFDEIVVTVTNRLPVASNAVVAPAEPRSFDDLVLTFDVSDPDGDATTGTRIDWFLDGAPVTDLANATTVPADRTRRGQVWYAHVTPNDGTGDGALVESSRVTIGNFAPVAANVRLEPVAPVRTDALTLSYDYSDEDGDAESGTVIAWFRNGVEQASLANAVRVPAPLTKGDTWSARVTPNDGALAGAAVDSATVTVGNTAPVITQLDDVARAASGATTPVSWTIVASDADGDTLSYSCFLGTDLLGTGASQSGAFAVGTYTIRCEVSDGTATTSDELTVAVGDVPPIVDAGADQTIDPGRPRVTAQGRDTLGRALLYTWTVVSSPETVSLLTPASPTVEFFARKAGDYRLRVTVSNGVASASDEVVITVRNVRPSADAGPASRSGREDVAITLDGSASVDPNGDTLTYLWERTSGPAIVNAGQADRATFTFTPDAAGELVMRLTVSDGALTGSTQVTILVAPAEDVNLPPTARAGADSTAIVGDVVALDGSGSTDVNTGTVLEYRWEAVSGPPAAIADPDAAVTSFVADEEGTYVFRLTVSDGTFESSDEVQVVVTRPVDGNRRPVARVAPTEVDNARTFVAVTLDGATSSDPDGDALTYQWSQVEGALVSLGSTDQPSVTFVPTAQGVIVIQLVVSDGRLSSIPVQVTVRVAEGTNLPPTAVATGPTGKIVGEVVTLDGTGSSDPEGATITYAWTRVSGPVVALSPSDAAQPSFTPAEAGEYKFRLVVSDGLFDSDPAEVTVTIVRNDAPIAVATGPARQVVGEPVSLDGSGSSDPEGNALTYVWTRVSGPAASLTGADTAAPSFTPGEAGTYVFRLVVNDGRFDSAPAEVTVVVDPLPLLTGGCATAGLELGFLPLAAALLARRRRRA